MYFINSSFIETFFYSFSLLLISPYYRIYASVIRVSIGSDKGLSPIRCQAIIKTNAVLLSTGPEEGKDPFHHFFF